MDAEELLRRLRECEGRKSQYMQKEPPERLPGPDPYGPDPFGLDAPPPPERLPGPDSDPFGLGPDPYAGKDLYDLPPQVAREIERRRGIKSRFANPAPPSINGSYAQPKASPAPSGYGSRRNYGSPVPMPDPGRPGYGSRRNYGSPVPMPDPGRPAPPMTPEYRGDPYIYRGISEEEVRRNAIRKLHEEYDDYRRGYGY